MNVTVQSTRQMVNAVDLRGRSRLSRPPSSSSVTPTRSSQTPAEGQSLIAAVGARGKRGMSEVRSPGADKGWPHTPPYALSQAAARTPLSDVVAGFSYQTVQACRTGWLQRSSMASGALLSVRLLNRLLRPSVPPAALTDCSLVLSLFQAHYGSDKAWQEAQRMRRGNKQAPPKPPVPKSVIRPLYVPIGVAIGLFLVYAKAASNANEVLKISNPGSLGPRGSSRWVG